MQQLQFIAGQGQPEQRTIRMSAQEPSAKPGHLFPAIVFLHGAGGSLDFWVSQLNPLLTQAGIALYAPQYFDRTGSSRADFTIITDGIHAPLWMDTIAEAIRFAAARPGVDPQRIVLAGISLGAFLGLGLAARQSGREPGWVLPRLRAVIDVSGGLVEPYAHQANASFPPTLILHGAEDKIVPASQAHALNRRLTELNVAHRTEILPGEGHWFSPQAVPRMLLALSSFLKEHLEQTRPVPAM